MKFIGISLLVLQVAVVHGQDAKYIGCYRDHGSTRDLPFYIDMSNVNKAAVCIDGCKAEGYLYAGLQAGYQCFCGNSYGSLGDAPDSECNMDCPGEPSQKCGDGNRNSIYTTGYMGCWKDSATAAMKNLWDVVGASMTIDLCVEKCRKSRFRYAGMQATEHCHCGDDYEFYGKAPESECNTPCRGNSAQMCGGLWRNSVYSTQTYTA